MGKSCRLLLALVLLLLAALALAKRHAAATSTLSWPRPRATRRGQGVSRAVIDQAFAVPRRPGTPPSSPSTAASAACSSAKSFEEYAATRVIPARISRARKLMQVHAALLGRIDQQFGVPAPVILAVWTLESDNGTGDMAQAAGGSAARWRRWRMTAAATELFQRELIAALQIVQRGDLPLRDLIGASCRRDRPGHSFCLRRTSSTASTTTATAHGRRSAPFRSRCAGLDRQSAQDQWLAGRRCRLPRARRISRWRCESGITPRSTARPSC